MSAGPLRFEGMAQTDVGCVREKNEDCYCALPHAGIYAVADGMGGHERGEWASAAVAVALAAVEADGSFDEGVNAVAEAIHAANARVYEEAQTLGAQMGTTVVAAVMRERRFGILWAGDSRAYLLRGGALHQLTRDHTQVQELIDRGILPADAADNHPMAHILSRALGVAPEIELEAVADEAKPGDLFLLCSDGLMSVVEDREIAAMLSDPLNNTPEALIGLARSRGAPDNVTVITISANEPTLLRLGEAAELVP
jgi:serine/threonine protein phosphatase PrpC